MGSTVENELTIYYTKYILTQFYQSKIKKVPIEINLSPFLHMLWNNQHPTSI